MVCDYCGGSRKHTKHCVMQRLTTHGVYRSDPGALKPGPRPPYRGTNPWIEHIKETQAQHPGMSYAKAMEMAAKTWKR